MLSLHCQCLCILAKNRQTERKRTSDSERIMKNVINVVCNDLNFIKYHWITLNSEWFLHVKPHHEFNKKIYRTCMRACVRWWHFLLIWVTIFMAIFSEFNRKRRKIKTKFVNPVCSMVYSPRPKSQKKRRMKEKSIMRNSCVDHSIFSHNVTIQRVYD